MATAGRILIIPKGRYNEETQYSMLDMVSYGGKGWICKKTCIGIAPEEGEYWAECIDVSEGFNGVNFKIDEVEAMVAEEIATRENDIAEVNDKVDVATNIAKGRNQAHVFNTTAEMQAWLSDSENKGLWSKGDNIYIVELDVPDWWVAEVLEEADAETGYYYKIAQLETQKVDLTDYVVDHLTSYATDVPLSANQGRVLSEKHNTKFLPNGIDVLSITENGRYYIVNGQNTPSGVHNYGYLDVTVYPDSSQKDNYKLLEYTPTNRNVKFINLQTAGEWSGWQRDFPMPLKMKMYQKEVTPDSEGRATIDVSELNASGGYAFCTPLGNANAVVTVSTLLGNNTVVAYVKNVTNGVPIASKVSLIAYVFYV